MLLTVTGRQLLGELRDGAVAILALDFGLRQGSTERIAVATRVTGAMAVLAQHAALRILRARLDLVMQVILDEQIVFAVQLRLLLVRRIVG